MARSIALLHYASPPVVGGVEATIAHHARGLANLGYVVRVISGSGAAFDDRIRVHIDPLFGSRHPQVLAVKQALDAGQVTDAFHTLVAQQVAALQAALADCDVCIAHNIHSLNKNLALTAALHQLAPPHSLAWCHDLAWTNPQYQPELHPGYPWDLLRQAWPQTRYVTISPARQAELAALLQVAPALISVVPPGVDVPAFLHWTPAMQQIAERLRLLEADVLLLLPARLTRRKNIALALYVLAELRLRERRDIRLIVTGPPGPHNPANPGYLGELLTLRRQLGLQTAAHFLYELAHDHRSAEPFIPDDPTIANLYQIADALLFPSLQEGFGIPILEAGLVNLPIFCSDLLPLRHSGQEDVFYFDPEQTPPAAIAEQMQRYFAVDQRHRLKTRVRQHYRWDALIRSQLVPLLEET